MIPGRIVRPFIILLCDREGSLEKRSMGNLFVRVIVPYMPLLLLAMGLIFWVTHNFSWGYQQASHEISSSFYIFAPASSLYILAYVAAGIARYRYTSNAKREHWEGLLGDRSDRLIREALISDAERLSTLILPVFAFGIPFVWALVQHALEFSGPGHENASNIGAIFASVLMLMLALIAKSGLERFAPHKRIIGNGFEILALLENETHGGTLFNALRSPSFEASRWRTRMHQEGFNLARSLEKALLGLHRRLADDDYLRMRSAFSKVANQLRKNAIEAETPGCRDTYRKLVSCSIALVVADQPMRAVAVAEELTSGHPERGSHPNKLLVALDKVNEQIQASWGSLKVIGTILTIVVVGASGTWSPIVDFFLSQK